MAKIKNPQINRLYEELRFSPDRQKESQLREAEKLLQIIEPAREYPYEFICFRITGYRPKENVDGIFIKGSDLKPAIEDFIRRLSSDLGLIPSGQKETVYTVEQLAEKFSVSTKTVRRWKSLGLVGRMFIFEDGKKRLGYLESAVEKFAKDHPHRIRAAADFSVTGPDEQQQAVELARRLLDTPKINKHQVINRVAEQMNRSYETIRKVIERHDEQNPARRIFPASRSPLNPRQQKLIYRLHKTGFSISEIARKYGKSRTTIHRAINRMRARKRKDTKIDYVQSPDFLKPDAHETILPEKWDAPENRPAAPLNRPAEVRHFQRYNYLKYLAALELARLDEANPSTTQLNRIDDYMAAAERIKQAIIEANMPLVISIARKHITTGASVAELASEGNLTLMRAVEKFDYTRGFRFSTYASWAIAKDFARFLPASAAYPETASADIENIHHDMRLPKLADVQAVEQAHHSLEKVIQNNLDDRERFIIRAHYGLSGSRVTQKGLSLKEIGDALNLTKERVRQIELIALQKLRHSLTPEEFQLLTG